MTTRWRVIWHRWKLRWGEFVSAERRVAAANARAKEAEQRAWEAHMSVRHYQGEVAMYEALMRNISHESAKGMLELQRRIDILERGSDRFWDEHVRRRPLP